MNRRRARAVLAALARMAPARRRRALLALPPGAFRAIEEEWWWQARGGQIEPLVADGGGEWRVWLIMAGRGFGKTRAGAERVLAWARAAPGARIALVGGSIAEVARVMIEGESGILACARSGEELRWTPSRGLLQFPSGAQAQAYSAGKPSMLRGPQHHFAWCDELAKWPKAGDTWDNLMFGLRLDDPSTGSRPRTIVTTTPAPCEALRRVMALKRLALTRGRTAENPDSAADFRSAMLETYGGTRLGRQELDGELFEDLRGALWTRETIEAARVSGVSGVSGDSYFQHGGARYGSAAGESNCPLVRIVVGVDPPASADGDSCGIVACGMAEDGTAYVLGDHSVAGMRPEGWARAAVAAAEAWGADRVVAEANNGGDMVESVLAGVDAGLPVRLVRASRGKSARAEPIASRFEAGKAKLAGRFPALEDQMAGMTNGGRYEGPGRSPDRADAMIWAMSELFKPERPMPRITRL
ncbi:MAG TPA: terminase family protein [Allosphingosinicella sp.]|nr:terminase family protein [Allosphingosinicella sp.]